MPLGGLEQLPIPPPPWTNASSTPLPRAADAILSEHAESDHLKEEESAPVNSGDHCEEESRPSAAGRAKATKKKKGKQPTLSSKTGSGHVHSPNLVGLLYRGSVSVGRKDKHSTRAPALLSSLRQPSPLALALPASAASSSSRGRKKAPAVSSSQEAAARALELSARLRDIPAADTQTRDAAAGHPAGTTSTMRRSASGHSQSNNNSSSSNNNEGSGSPGLGTRAHGGDSQPQPPLPRHSTDRRTSNVADSGAHHSPEARSKSRGSEGGGASQRTPARPVGYAESPGTVKGSYVNENIRLVVSEPQYSSREKRSLGLAEDDGADLDRHASLSLTLSRAEGVIHSRPLLALPSSSTSRGGGGGPPPRPVSTVSPPDGRSPSSPMPLSVNDRGLPPKHGSSPGRWLTGGGGGLSGARKSGAPSPLVDAHGSPFKPEGPAKALNASLDAPHLPSSTQRGGAGSGDAGGGHSSHSCGPTLPPSDPLQHTPPSAGAAAGSAESGALASPRMVASSDAFTHAYKGRPLGGVSLSPRGVASSGPPLQSSSNSPSSAHPGLGAGGAGSGPDTSLRPHHPASSPPLGTFMRHNLQPKRNAAGSAGGGDVFLTPPAVGTLRAPPALMRKGEAGAGGGGTALLAGVGAGPSPQPASATSLSLSPNVMRNGQNGPYTGLLTSLSPRRHQQQPHGIHDSLGLVNGDRGGGGGGNAAIARHAAAAAGLGGGPRSQEDLLASTQLLTSIRELTKRRLSEEASGGGGGSLAALQRGEASLDDARAFALGGGGGGGGGSGSTAMAVSGDVGFPGGATAAANFDASGTAPSQKGTQSRKHKKGGGGGGASSILRHRHSKRNKFSLQGAGTQAAGSLTSDLFGVTNSGRTAQQRQQQRTLRQEAEAAASAEKEQMGGPQPYHLHSTYARGGAMNHPGQEMEEAGAKGRGDGTNDGDDDDDFFSDPAYPLPGVDDEDDDARDTAGRHHASSPPVLSLSPPPTSSSSHGEGPRLAAPPPPPPGTSTSSPGVTSSSPLPNSSTSTPAYDFKVILSSGSGLTKPIVLASGSGCVQGMRSTMEDEHFVKLNEFTVGDHPVSLLGILDGHCGRRVATLGKKLLPHYFFQHSALGANNALAMVESVLQTDRDIFYELHSKRKPKKAAGVGRASAKGRGGGRSHHIFNATHNGSGGDGGDDADEEDVFASLTTVGGGEGMVGGGSTLIAAAVHGRMLYVACLGDARAVLLDGRTSIAMSDDHKPQNPKESKRIARCGGFVQFGRVCGVLAVSRALGDFEFKFTSEGLTGGSVPWWVDEGPSASASSPASTTTASRSAAKSSSSSSAGGGAGGSHTSRFCGNKELMVSNVADVKQLSLTDESKFLVLACDGLWDVLSNEEATQFVKDFLTFTPDINDPAAADGQKPKPTAAVVKRALDSCCQKLAEFAVDRGSTDNVSVTLLFFHDVVDCVTGFHRRRSSRSTGGSGAGGGSRSGHSSTASNANTFSRFSSEGGVGIGTAKKKKKKKAL